MRKEAEEKRQLELLLNPPDWYAEMTASLAHPLGPSPMMRDVAEWRRQQRERAMGQADGIDFGALSSAGSSSAPRSGSKHRSDGEANRAKTAKAEAARKRRAHLEERQREKVNKRQKTSALLERLHRTAAGGLQTRSSGDDSCQNARPQRQSSFEAGGGGGTGGLRSVSFAHPPKIVRHRGAMSSSDDEGRGSAANDSMFGRPVLSQTSFGISEGDFASSSRFSDSDGGSISSDLDDAQARRERLKAPSEPLSLTASYSPPMRYHRRLRRHSRKRFGSPSSDTGHSSGRRGADFPTASASAPGEDDRYTTVSAPRVLGGESFALPKRTLARQGRLGDRDDDDGDELATELANSTFVERYARLLSVRKQNKERSRIAKLERADTPPRDDEVALEAVLHADTLHLLSPRRQRLSFDEAVALQRPMDGGQWVQHVLAPLDAPPPEHREAREAIWEELARPPRPRSPPLVAHPRDAISDKYFVYEGRPSAAGKRHALGDTAAPPHVAIAPRRYNPLDQGMSSFEAAETVPTRITFEQLCALDPQQHRPAGAPRFSAAPSNNPLRPGSRPANAAARGLPEVPFDIDFEGL
jgi:hypothetical protein